MAKRKERHKANIKYLLKLKFIKQFILKGRRQGFLFLSSFSSCHHSNTQKGQTVIVKAAHTHNLRGSDGLFLFFPGYLICLVKVVLSSLSYLSKRFTQKHPESMMLMSSNIYTNIFWSSNSVVLKLEWASESPGGFVKAQISGICSQIFWFSTCKVESKNLHSQQIPIWCWCSCLGITLWELLFWVLFFCFFF